MDVGCGTGAVIALLAEKYPEKHYTGIDLSSKMIEVASAKKTEAVEMPLLHLLGKGDVACYGQKDFEGFCRESGLQLELFEQRKGFRLHSVMRKSI